MAADLLLGLPVRVRVKCVPQGWLEGREIESEATGHIGTGPFVKVELTEESWALFKEFSPTAHADKMSQRLWFPQTRVTYS